jgi:heme o synthase
MAVGSHPSGLPTARAIVPSRLTPSAVLGHAGARTAPRSKVGAYVALTKPRIIELLLVTTVPTMILAAKGFPSLGLVLATLVGGSLAAGGANAINMFVDRDIDRLMPRTQHRPLVTGAVTPRAALVFAIALEVIAFAELSLVVNVLSAVLALSATLFYVFVYTLWLKRTSTRNIVIGGAAGAVPVLVGWAAVTDGLAWAPIVLFGMIFLWTPPHFWALAIRYADDYRSAHVPMLPAVSSLEVTSRRMLGYTVALVGLSLVLVPVADTGWIYAAAAALLGAAFIGAVIGLRQNPTAGRAMRVFAYSISYVTLLFGALAVDTLAGHGL